MASKVFCGQMIDFIEVLGGLSHQRPVFHSEADFQHAYAWALQTAHPAARIRLEYPHPSLDGRAYLDIWVELGGVRAGIELKYKTQAVDIELSGERFDLRYHSAQDQGRYDFCRDVSRVERIAARDAATRGLAIFVTNDSAYWRPKRPSPTADDQFRLCDGSLLQGERQWLPRAIAGPKGGRDAPININGEYSLNWRPYSSIDAPRYSAFKFLALEAL